MCCFLSVSEEYRLMKDLFEGYNVESRPVLNSSQPVEIGLKFVLLNLNELASTLLHRVLFVVQPPLLYTHIRKDRTAIHMLTG